MFFTFLPHFIFFKYKVLENLQGALEQLFQWYFANRLVANARKCHLLTSSKITNNIASRLNFDYHGNTLSNKANKKYHALARVCNYMNTNKQRIIMKAFITSQLSYCSLVWMFHSRAMNNRINILH